MSLGDLYTRDVLRLAAAATGAGRLAAPGVTVERVNPVCGDRIIVDVLQAGGRIAAFGYEVTACVLCQASASILGKEAVSRTRADIARLGADVKAMLAGAAGPAAPFAAYGALQAVAPHKGRHTCVLLPVEALLEALER